MAIDNLTAPGRSALWTEVALRALTGSAWTETPWDEQDNPRPLDPQIVAAVVGDAISIADAFEAACVACHEAEQKAEREERDAWLANATAKVLATKRYRCKGYTGDPVLTVDRVIGSRVRFHPDAYVAHGAPMYADLVDVTEGDSFEAVDSENGADKAKE